MYILTHTLPDPYKRVIELRVYGLQVFEDKLLVQHAFVEGQGEACVNEFPMEKCLQPARNKRDNLFSCAGLSENMETCRLSQIQIVEILHTKP